MSDNEYPPLPPGPNATWDEVKRWSNIAVLAKSCQADFAALGFQLSDAEAWQKATAEYERNHL